MNSTCFARRLAVRALTRRFLIIVIVAACLAPQALSQRRKQTSPQPGKRQSKAKTRKVASAIPPDIQAALDRISADSLRGHLSFIASDLLEGRNTPSRGLEIAAEYIAAQFRRAGLEPAGDAKGESYFQTSQWTVGPVNNNFIELTVDDGNQKMRARPDQLAALEVNLEQKADAASGPEKQVIKLSNVVGLLRGSDPVLKDSYVIVSAHYDHIGVRPTGEGDRINNGANDDGSGTVSVIELASALASLKQKPKRSIVFIAWFGEEKGLQGSRYYGRHPIFPLEKTVAMVNLEHLGRTDDNEGPRLDSSTLTGFDFTDLGPIFRGAGEKTGVKVYKDEKNSDSFFSRSDNQALADAGIPAHTLCVAFIFPDYHRVGDHWEKIDYSNLARVNRMIALSLMTIADNVEAPRWNEANPKTEKYVKAWKQLHNK